jgi:hypothetical protein
MFCGVTAQEYAISGVTYQWPRGSVLTWSLDFSKLGRLSDMDCKDAITAFLKEHSEAGDIRHRYTSDFDAANVQIVKRPFDGRSGVLADAQIPVGNVHSGTRLLMRFDENEDWGLAENPTGGLIDFYRTGSHEFLHIEGLGHQPASIQVPALIAPVYSPALRYLQAADKAELVRRYGAAAPRPPQSPTSPPSAQVPGGKPVNYKTKISIEQDGKRWEGDVAGVLQRVS